VPDEPVGPVWGGAASDPDLQLPEPTGAGRLTLVAQRPWTGVAVAVDAYAGRVAVAGATSITLGVLPDLGQGHVVPLAGVRRLTFAPGQRVLVAEAESGVTAVSLDRPRGSGPAFKLRTPGAVDIAASPGGRLLALAGRVARPRATLGVWDIERSVRLWTASPLGAMCAAWVDGYLLAVAGRELRLYSHEGERLPAAPAPRGENIEALASGPSGLVSAGRGNVATLWDARLVTAVATLPVPAGAAKVLALGPHTLAVGTVRAGGAVALVDLARRTVDRVLLGVRAAAFADPWLVVTGQAGTATFRWEP
jgi:hypothetical protein